jgi:hypothetical protein
MSAILLSRECPVCGAKPHKQCKGGSHYEARFNSPIQCDCDRCKDDEPMEPDEQLKERLEAIHPGITEDTLVSGSTDFPTSYQVGLRGANIGGENGVG